MKKILLWLALLISVSVGEEIPLDSVLIVEQRFAEKEAFHAVVLLDRYLRSHSSPDLEFWRIWGEIQIEDVESAERHLFYMDSLLRYDQALLESEDLACLHTRLKLLNLYRNYNSALQSNFSDDEKEDFYKRMRRDFAKIRNSECLFKEDRSLYSFMRSVVKPGWTAPFSGLLSYGIGYSDNPIQDENKYENSESKAFHSLITGLDFKPWMKNFPVQPFVDLRFSSWYYFPDAATDFHRGVIRTRFGSAWQNARFYTKISFIGSLTFQKDSLYSGYPIYQEHKAVELDWNIWRQLGFTARMGSRLFRDRLFSRSEYEGTIYGKKTFGNKLYGSASISGGVFRADDSWNNFVNEMLSFSVLWQVHPAVQFWNHLNLEYRYYDYAKSVRPREDWIWQWQPTVSWRLAPSLQLNLSYAYLHKKVNNIKSAPGVLAETLSIQDHTVSLFLEWKPVFDTKRFSTRPSSYSLPAPWASGVSPPANIEFQSNIEQSKDQMDFRETQQQGHRCRE